MSTSRPTTPTADDAREAAARLLVDVPPASVGAEEFLAAQFDAGLAWVELDRERGGRSWPAELQTVVDVVLREGGAPHSWDRNPMGFGMGAPTLIAHGTDDQLDRWLRPLFCGDEVWCQLFSEPAAGSDLAGLETRAERDGDEWVINGQKVWTSLAQISRRGMLVARTDPTATKHQGLSYFIVDMATPGVEVRPLVQITGDAEFNEVYFTDVRVSDRDLLGGPGAGWRISMTTLSSERVALGGAMEDEHDDPIALARRIWDRRGGSAVQRDRLAALCVRSEVLRLTNERATHSAEVGRAGPEGTIGKLAHAELMQEIYSFCVDLLGPAGGLFSSYGLTVFQTAAPESDVAQQQFLYSRCASIAGGTSEVLRNLIGEQLLGLPREPRVDKDRPWTEVRNR